MDELIVNFLHDFCTPEHSEAIIKALDVLIQMEFYDAETYIIERINSVDEKGVDDVITNIIQYIDGALTKAIGVFGITLEEDVNYIKKLDYLLALIELDSIADKDIVRNYLDDGYDSVETLANILAFTTPYDAEDFLMDFVSVSPSLIKRLNEVYPEYSQATNEEESPVDSEEVIKKRKLFDHYRNFTHDEYGPLKQVMDEGYPLNMPFENYFNELVKLMPQPGSVDYMKSLALIPVICNAEGAADEIIKQHVELLDPNPGIAMRTYSNVRTYIVAFQNYLNQLKVLEAIK